MDEPVDVHGQLLRIPLSISDALDQCRSAQGEDEWSGVCPVFYETLPVELGEDDDNPEEDDGETTVAYSVWTEEDRKKLLSKIPIEALTLLFEYLFGRKWWRQEPEVILETLGRAGLILDAGGYHRVMALHSIIDSPRSWCPFYYDPGAFYFLTVSLSGRPAQVDTLVVPTPLEMAIAMNVIQDIRPEAYDREVLAAAAAACYQHGLWALPGILNVAQPGIYRIADSLDAPVSPAEVASVFELARRERIDDTTIPEDALTWNQAQALRVIDFEDRLDAALDKGAAARVELADKLEFNGSRP